MSFYNRLFKKKIRVGGAGGSGGSPIPSYLMPPDGTFSKIGFQIYEALDLICEGPILGLTDQNGKVLKGGCYKGGCVGNNGGINVINDNTDVDDDAGGTGVKVATTQAVHVYDLQNAEVTYTDVWQLKVTTIIDGATSQLSIIVEREPISRTLDIFPEKAANRIVRPDGQVIASNYGNGRYIRHDTTTYTEVGDVYEIQYFFNDALNYVNDPNTKDTGWITFATVTFTQTLTTFVAGQNYVNIEVLHDGEVYDTRSFLRKPGT